MVISARVHLVMSLSKSRFHNYRSLRPLTATRDLAIYSQFGGSGLYYAGTVYWGCHHRQELVQTTSGCCSQAAGTGTSTVVDCALINSVPYSLPRGWNRLFVLYWPAHPKYIRMRPRCTVCPRRCQLRPPLELVSVSSALLGSSSFPLPPVFLFLAECPASPVANRRERARQGAVRYLRCVYDMPCAKPPSPAPRGRPWAALGVDGA